MITAGDERSSEHKCRGCLKLRIIKLILEGEKVKEKCIFVLGDLKNKADKSFTFTFKLHQVLVWADLDPVDSKVLLGSWNPSALKNNTNYIIQLLKSSG